MLKVKMSTAEFESFYDTLNDVPSLRALGEHYLIKRDALIYVAKMLAGEAVDYYEFGIFKGKTFLFAQETFSKESSFYGYDSFHGLPEEWLCHIPWREDLPKEPFRPTLEQSHNNFDLKGEVPEPGKGRFFKGLFQDTLGMSLREQSHKKRKVILIDCDLYSSTLVVLTQMHGYLKSGDILIFDEFGDILNEFKAFSDYKKWFYRQDQFECLFKDEEQRLVFGFMVK